MIAQSPNRFTGQVHVAGKELMSLAFHAGGYTLRNVSDRGDLPVGFYSGTQTQCALQPLIGSSLTPQEFVQAVLGGIPALPAVQTGLVEVVKQTWDRARGVEVLRVRNGIFVHDLRFTWFENTWWPIHATQWRETQGEARRMWTLEHEDLHTVAGAVLPKRTRISRPAIKGDETVVITYRKQVPNPSLPGVSANAGEPEADTGDEGWDDDGWGDDEGEWEGEEGATPTKPTEPAAKAPQPAAVPAIFVLSGADLPNRGDLCTRV